MGARLKIGSRRDQDETNVHSIVTGPKIGLGIVKVLLSPAT